MVVQDLPENQVTFWYQVYLGEIDEVDDEGNRTGDKVKEYSEPVEARARISANTGNASDSPFGQNIVYDKAISTVEKLPIDEQTLLFIDREPIYNAIGRLITEPDYCCTCVKNGLHQNVWAVKKIRGSINENQSQSF